MKRNQIFMAAGAFALAIGSFFAGNAAKKLFTTVNALYWQDATSGVCQQIAGASIFTTTTSSNEIVFKTGGGTTVP